MYSSGRKGKKNKGTVISLQSFLSDNEVPIGTTQVSKNIRTVDGEDSDDEEKISTLVCQLPTAPRANRIFDENVIPHKAPFIAYVTNLPFDIKEDDIFEYFNLSHVKSVRLPREEGDSGRSRGFGYVEFKTREDLIYSLGISDPVIKGRKIRIDLSNEDEQSLRQRGIRKGNETFIGKVEGRESTNWRCNNDRKKIYSYEAERNFNKDFKITSDNNSPGSWRSRNPSNFSSSSFEQVYEKDREIHVKGCNKISSERPKLMLKPRTLPLPDLGVVPLTGLKSEMNDLNASKFTDVTVRDLEMKERLTDVCSQKNLHKKNENRYLL